MSPPADNPWETEIYGKGRQVNRWPYTSVISGVMRLLGSDERSEARVLELGCGTGNNLRFLAEEGFQAFGIDASKTAIELAGQQLAGWGLDAGLHFGTFTELPFDDEYFDLVIDRAAIVHNEYADVVRALHESHRVLKPGAHILSIGLKGINHPDRSHGTRLGPHTWGNFSAGKFEAVGVTCFFEAEDINPLFSGFAEVMAMPSGSTGTKSSRCGLENDSSDPRRYRQ